MKEFDFDELDRAVSSLMDKAGADQPPKPQSLASDHPTQSTLPSTSSSSNDTSSDESRQNDRPVTVSRNASSSPAAERTRPISSPERPVEISTSSADVDPLDDAETKSHQSIVSPTSGKEPSSVKETPKDKPSPTSKSAETKLSNRITPHRSGRFMDMVHPSADMKSDQSKTAADQLTSPSPRRGVTIKPLDSSLKRPTLDVVKPAPASESVATTPSPEPTVETTDSESDWPDPIEQAEQSNETPKSDAHEDELLLEAHTSSDVSLTKNEEIESDDTETLDSIEQNNSLDTNSSADTPSPFLPGTKVEKRPLGGASETAPKEDEGTFGDVGTTDEMDTQELDKRLLEIESDDTETLDSIEQNNSLDTNSSADTPSPFLPGTKVEKRPLGGASETAPKEDEGTFGDVGTTDEMDTQELDKRLLEIESGKDTEELADRSASRETFSDKRDEKVQSERPSSPQSASSSTSASVTRPQGPISIPQQYQEKPSSGDESNGAIFDTSTYHQPLAHPAKKKSGWIWVLVIVALIVIGAAAGAIAFQQGYL